MISGRKRSLIIFALKSEGPERTSLSSWKSRGSSSPNQVLKAISVNFSCRTGVMLSQISLAEFISKKPRFKAAFLEKKPAEKKYENTLFSIAQIPTFYNGYI